MGFRRQPRLDVQPQIADIAFKAKEIPAPDAMIVIMQEALPALSVHWSLPSV